MNRLLFYSSLCLALLLVGKLQAEEIVLVVYTDPVATVKASDGRELGSSGKPFRFKLPETSDAGFRLESEGYQPREVLYPISDLRKSGRIPAQGVLELEAKRSYAPFLVVTVLFVGAIGAWRMRSQPVAEPTIKKSAPKFEPGRLLGEGATAKVYAATSPAYPGGNLAVKVLKSGQASQDSAKARLLRSLEKSLALEHPNLVKLYDSGETAEGLPYILMERLQGTTLEEHLARKSPLPNEEVLKFLEQLCSALQYLHQQTIVHRDVKPENIFLTQNGQLKVMDLEISRAEGGQDLTRTGVVVGTPFYLAPEQIRGKAVPQSDQYAVGIILFEMLTGRRPFEGEDSLQTINQHMNETPPSVVALNPEVNSLQEAVLGKMLAKDPKNRFSTMDEAWSAIEEAFGAPSDDDQTATSY